MNPRAIEKVKIHQSSLTGVGPSVIRNILDKDGYAYVATDSTECQMILKYAKNENVRRQVYESMNSATKESIMTLEQLMMTRSELATLVGRESYAELQLQDKMAKNPSKRVLWLIYKKLLTYFSRKRRCFFKDPFTTPRSYI